MPGFNDNLETAAAIASTITDPRVRHFYDPFPSHLAGKAFARDVISTGRGSAWDIYLFYGEDAVWDEYPPAPAAFTHQLSGGIRADAERFRTGDALVSELRNLMLQMQVAKHRD